MPTNLTRRDLLFRAGGGFASLALTDLLARAATVSPLAAKPPHFPAKAKHCVFLFMNGAPSHIDTFDPKPALTKYNGEPYKGNLTVGSNGRPIGYLMKSPFEFKRCGQSGLEISSLFPHTSAYADDLCVIRSMYTDTAAHASGCLQMNTGSIFIGKPSLGSWLTATAWERKNEDLPSFVVMTDPRGGPISGPSQLDRRVHACRVSGHAVPQHRGPPVGLDHPVRSHRPHPAGFPRSAQEAQSATPRIASERIGAGSSHLLLRTRLPHADRCIRCS